MVLTDLRFRRGPLTTPPIDLVFGSVGGPPPSPEATLDVDAVLPKTLRGFGALAVVTKLEIDAVLPKLLRGFGALTYQSRTMRDIGPSFNIKFQQATNSDVGLRVGRFQQATRTAISSSVVGAEAVPLHKSATVRQQDALGLHQPLQVREQEATPIVPPAVSIRWQEALRNERPSAIRYQDATPLHPRPTKIRFQEALRSSYARNRSKFQEARPLLVRRSTSYQNALPHSTGPRGRYQDAIQPAPGKSVVPPVVPDPCYIPPPGDQVHLLFKDPWSNSPHLVFICERHGGGVEPPDGETIVVPVRKVYLVINSSSLVRVDGNVPIRCPSMSLSIDVDSWTWSFSARLPASELEKVEPDSSGTPVEVKATINGVPYHMLVESIGRDREFPRKDMVVSGRGLAASLDSPYVPILNFGNDDPRTANQLMEDVLMDNGVPLPDWIVNWGLDDWDVPGGVWRLQGSYIGALTDIVGAAGGYLQSHRSTKTLMALPRYPVAPWDWAGVTPDYELPASPNQRESIEWVEKARYNAVFVSGINAGILGHVKREGSAGDVLAEMVTHALITDIPAARQRGLAILGDTGRIANLTLRLPVLPETGIITPGKFVRYVDGATTRIGLTRGVSVDVGQPTIYQSILLETHP